MVDAQSRERFEQEFDRNPANALASVEEKEQAWWGWQAALSHPTPQRDEQIEELKELRHLFSVQQRQMQKAAECWQDATGRKNVLPDLGGLLQWLMKEKDEARKTSLGDAAKWILQQESSWTLTDFCNAMGVDKP